MEIPDTPSKKRKIFMAKEANVKLTFVSPPAFTATSTLTTSDQNQPAQSQEYQVPLFRNAAAELLQKHAMFGLQLNLDEETKTMSLQLLTSFIGRVLEVNDPNQIIVAGSVYSACALWVVSRLKSHRIGASPGTCVSISQVFKTYNVTPVDFFTKTIFFLSLNQIMDAESVAFVETEINSVAFDYKILSEAYAHLREYMRVLCMSSSSDPHARRTEEEFLMDSMRFVWILFLYTKEKLLTREKLSRKNFFTALLCSLKFTLHNLPGNFFRKFDDVSRMLKLDTSSLAEMAPNAYWTNYYELVFGTIVCRYDEDLDDYRRNELIFFEFVHSEFVASRIWLFAEEDSRKILVGAFDVKNRALVQRNSESINRKYQELIQPYGRLDGTAFLSKHDSAMTPRKLTKTPCVVVKTPAARSLRMEILRASSLSASMQSTPLSARNMNSKRMNMSYAEDNFAAGERLKQTLLSQGDEPSPLLRQFLANFQVDVCMITETVAKSLEALRKLAPASEALWKLAAKFYYRTLELMINGEEKRQGLQSKICRMVQDAKFHSSLLCCSFELIKNCFEEYSFSFDALVTILEVPLFELCMVIELSLKYDGQLLNWSLTKRLKEIEERILECEIWKKEEPLYRLLGEERSKVEHGQFCSIRISYIRLLRTENFEGKALKQVTCQIAELHPDSATNLEIFFRKLIRLLHSRLVSLCQELGLPDMIIKRSWVVLVEGLLIETQALIYSQRHIDQVLLCTIYSVCRFHNVEKKLVEIIHQYRKQPQSNHDIANNIIISGDTKGTLVDFYNKVFTPKMKHIICASNKAKPEQSLQDTHAMPMTPLKLKPLAESSMTPRTKVLFNPGEASAMKMATDGMGEKVLKSARKLNLTNSMRKSSTVQDSPEPCKIQQPQFQRSPMPHQP